MIGATLAVLLAVLLGTLYLFLRLRYTYWRSRKIPGPAPFVPFGNCVRSLLGRRAVYEDFAEIYQRYKKEPYVGIYYLHTPLLLLHDLDIAKEVFVKEFQDFSGRGMYSQPEQDHLSGHLFNLSGQAWRNMRVKLSPTLTTGKIKQIFARIEECADNLQKHTERLATAGGGSYEDDVRELMARYATDIISSVIFGIGSNTIEDPNSEFRVMGKRMLEPTITQGMRFNLMFFGRDLMHMFGISIQSPEVNDFFIRLVTDTISYREQNNVERADLLNLLIQLKNKGFVPPDSSSSEDGGQKEVEVQKLSLPLVIAQMFVFFIAGFETTSTTISYTLYELARNPKVLEKVVEEIDAVMQKYEGRITYESVMNVPYLDKVISETLRLYPPVSFLTREAMKERTLPRTDIMLEKGTTLVIPVNAIHRDPDIWVNPDTFDPERFNEENKQSIHPMAYLPFGNGPRLCIGMRLGLVQVKAALMAVLSRCTVSPSPNTPDKIKIEPWSVVPAPCGGLPVLLTRRTVVPA